MRDDTTMRGMPATVAQQPDPMLDEQPPGPFRVGATFVGALAIVALVMYGLSRPAQEPAQMASAPEAAQTGEPATNGQAAAPEQGQKQAAQPKGAAQPATTGQGQSQGQAQAPADQGKQGSGKSPRADSATTGQSSAPSDKAAPPAKK